MLKQEELSVGAKKLQRAYAKEWRSKNIEKSRQYKKNYWTKKALELAE